MSTCCPICHKVEIGVEQGLVLKESTKTDLLNKEVELQQRFFQLLQRYLDEGVDKQELTKTKNEREFRFPLEKFAGIGMLSCVECSKLMESFCELYHQLKSTELLLNWKLETLNSVMSCALKVPSRMFRFQTFLGKLAGKVKNVDDLSKSVTRTTKILIKKCSPKTGTTFPKLYVSKWDSLEEIIPRSIAPCNFVQFGAGKVSVSDNLRCLTSMAEQEDTCSSFHEGMAPQFPSFLQSLPPCGKTANDDGHLIESTDSQDDSANNDIAADCGKVLSSHNQCDELDQAEPIELHIDVKPSVAPDLMTEMAGTSRLRTTYRCDRCGKTFSTNEKLQVHVTAVHQDTEGVEDDLLSSADNCSDDSDVASENDDNCDASLDCGSGHLSSSSSSDTDSDPEDSLSINNDLYDSDQRNSDVKDIKITKGHTEVDQMDDSVRSRSSRFRMKCPDCNSLFDGVKAILIHRKNLNSCPGQYDTARSIRVEVWVPPKYIRNPDIPDFSIVKAVINIPQEIHVCEVCERVAYSTRDMEAHKALHGKFNCSICDLKTSYAPKLSSHELNHTLTNPSTSSSTSTSGRISKYRCDLCDFKCRTSSSYIQHHLQCRFSLTLRNHVCPICKSNAMALSKDKLAIHFKTQHDISNIGIPNDIIQCTVTPCDAYFLSGQQLLYHLQWHHNIVSEKRKRKLLPQPTCDINNPTTCRLKCPDCSLLFKDTKCLLIHRKNSKCCLRSFDPTTSVKVEVMVPSSNKSDVIKWDTVHALIDLPQQIFICEDCELPLYSPEDLENHKKLHSEFTCKFCDVKTTYAVNMAFHALLHTKGYDKKNKRGSHSTIKCPECDFTISHGGLNRRRYAHHFLKDHLSLILNEPLCAICKTESTEWRVSTLPKHFKMHHDLTHNTSPEDLKRCTVGSCDAYFIQAIQLGHHLRLRHNFKEVQRKGFIKKTNKCKDCNRSFTTPHGLRGHRLRTHVSSEKILWCPFKGCSKKYESEKDLKAHMDKKAWHEKVAERQANSKVYVKCKECGKSISGGGNQGLSGNMKHHMESHKVSHVCELCGKVFKETSGLRQHYRSHSGPDSWEFMCSICSKKCLTKQKLDEHMRTHSKEKPFVCEVCGVKYAHRHNLRIHVNSKHGNEEEDKPRKFDKTNLTPKRGAKRKRTKNVEQDNEELSSVSNSD